MNITLTQTITAIDVNTTGQLETVYDAPNSPSLLKWAGSVTLKNANGKEIDAKAFHNIIEKYRWMPFSNLNTISQSLYSKDYDDCTGSESKAVRHKYMGDNWKTDLKASIDIDISDSDVDTLVTNILSNCIS